MMQPLPPPCSSAYRVAASRAALERPWLAGLAISQSRPGQTPGAAIPVGSSPWATDGRPAQMTGLSTTTVRIVIGEFMVGALFSTPSILRNLLGQRWEQARV